VCDDPGSNLSANGCVYSDGYCDMQPWARAAPYCSAYVNSALRPCAGSLNRVPASAGIRAGMSSLPGGT